MIFSAARPKLIGVYIQRSNDQGLVVDNRYILCFKDRNMNRIIEETGKAEACTAGISNIIIRIIAYLFPVVPVLALTITGAMNPCNSHRPCTRDYRFYVTEKIAALTVSTE